MKLAVYDEHEAVTTPNALDIPIVLRPPPKPFPWKVLAWCGAVSLGILAMSICIAITVSFLVDLVALGGGAYAGGVVLSSASLGALLASAGFLFRRPR